MKTQQGQKYYCPYIWYEQNYPCAAQAAAGEYGNSYRDYRDGYRNQDFKKQIKHNTSEIFPKQTPGFRPGLRNSSLMQVHYRHHKIKR